MEHITVYRNADGIRRTMVSDSEAPGQIKVLTEIDVEGVIESNKIARELQPVRATNRLLAKGVPMTVVEKSLREQWDDSDWKKWLNDPDNAAFRIWPGRV